MGAAHGQGPHDVLDPAPIIAAAQQAAAAGDYSEAERLLREAAARQELSLGPLHPDLASTLTDAAVMPVSGGLGRSTGAGVVSARLSSVTAGCC